MAPAISFFRINEQTGLPSTVLVTLHDGTPVVKVIDFGVAKAIGQLLTDKTIYNRFTQTIGTPLYMSPEQAEMSGLDIDTRSEIFSRGVLLYELLTGSTPADPRRLETASFDDIRRIIRDEELQRPSIRTNTTVKAALATASARRLSGPRKLSALLQVEQMRLPDEQGVRRATARRRVPVR